MRGCGRRRRKLGQYLQFGRGDGVDVGGQVASDQFVVLGVEHHVGDRCEPDEFGQRERRVCGAPPGGDDHLADRRGAQRRQRGVGDVGVLEGIGVGGQDPGHVECDVAVADDPDALVSEIGWRIGNIGVAVDPGHRLGGGPGAGQTHAGYVESAIVGGTHRIEHRMMVLEQFGM